MAVARKDPFRAEWVVVGRNVSIGVLQLHSRVIDQTPSSDTSKVYGAQLFIRSGNDKMLDKAVN